MYILYSALLWQKEASDKSDLFCRVLTVLAGYSVVFGLSLLEALNYKCKIFRDSFLNNTVHPSSTYMYMYMYRFI